MCASCTRPAAELGSAATELASATEPDEEQPKAKYSRAAASYLRAGEGKAR